MTKKERRELVQKIVLSALILLGMYAVHNLFAYVFRLAFLEPALGVVAAIVTIVLLWGVWTKPSPRRRR